MFSSFTQNLILANSLLNAKPYPTNHRDRKLPIQSNYHQSNPLSKSKPPNDMSITTKSPVVCTPSSQMTPQEGLEDVRSIAAPPRERALFQRRSSVRDSSSTYRWKTAAMGYERIAVRFWVIWFVIVTSVSARPDNIRVGEF